MIKRLFNKLFAQPTGFGSAGIRRQRISGAIIVIGGLPWTSAQRGISEDELGINISNFAVRYYLAVNEKLPSGKGEPRARAQSDAFSRDITLRGETLGTTGVMDFTMATACTLANDITTFAPTGSGGPPIIDGVVLLDEATVTQERAGWKSLDMRLSSDPQLIAI